MGAAAALIPGIVGIAGGEYAGYKKRQGEAAEDAGLMAGARQLATGGAGDSINPILGRRSPQMADRNAILGQMAGTNPSIARAMVANQLEQMGKAPALKKYVVYYDQEAKTRRSVPEGTPPGPNEIPIGESDALPKAVEAQKPLTDFAKLNADKNAGLITQQQYDQALIALKPKAEAPKSTFDDERKLSGEFDKKTQEFTVVRDAYSALSSFDASPAGDIGLIFSLMKMYDPNSSVRETEYANAQNAGSIPEMLRARFNKAKDGETLTPSQRADFIRQAGNVYASKKKSFDEELARYTDLAKKYGLEPSRIVYNRDNGVNPSPKNAGMSDPGFDFAGMALGNGWSVTEKK